MLTIRFLITLAERQFKIVSYGSNIPTINKGIYWSEEKEALGTALTNVLNGSSDLDSAIEEAQATIEFNIGQ